MSLSAVVVLVALAVCPPLAHAQTVPPPDSGGPVDTAEAGGSGIVPIRIGPATLSGSAWLEEYSVEGDTRDPAADTFRIRRARVGLSGNLAPRVGWNISGELTAD